MIYALFFALQVAELKEKLSQHESGAIIPSKSSRLDDLNMQEISRYFAH